MAERTSATPAAKKLAVSAMPNGGRRFTSSHLVARSMSLRASRTIAIRASDVHHAVQPLDLLPERPHAEDLAGNQPRPVMSGTGSPVSSPSRNRNVDPPVSTISLITEVVMISRRSRWTPS